MAPTIHTYRPFAAIEDWLGVEVTSMWDEHLDLLGTARQGASKGALDLAVRYTLRAAALQSGAIEGLYAVDRGITHAVAIEATAWETDLSTVGPDVLGHFSANLDAFDLVLDIATRERPLTEAGIREVHSKVTANQPTYRVRTAQGPTDRPLGRGVYKSEENHVRLKDGTQHWHAPVIDVSPEMARLIQQVQKKEFQNANPLIQTAYVHHAITTVHPFADGNGRTARAIASTYLYRAAGIPLLVFSDTKPHYLDALEAADSGDYQTLTRFVEDRAVDAMNIVTSQLIHATNPLEEAGPRLEALFVAHGGLTHAELQAVGGRLFQSVWASLQAAAQTVKLPPDVKFEGFGGSVSDCNYGNRPYHLLRNPQMVGMRLKTDQPEAIAVQLQLVAGLADAQDNRYAFVIVDIGKPDFGPLRMRVDQLYPAIGQAGQMQIDEWARSRIAALVDEFDRTLSQRLQAEGY